MKPGKVLCCMFLFVILGFFSAENVAKYKRRVCGFIQLTNRSIAIMQSVNMKQKMRRVKDLPT